MKKKLILSITVFLLCVGGFAQVYDLGFGYLSGAQDGHIIVNGSKSAVVRQYYMPAGRLDVYKPLLRSKGGNLTCGIQTGLGYAYLKSREELTRDPKYIELMESQGFFSRTFGALQVPLMAGIRSGRFSTELENDRRSFGLCAGAELITFYLPSERGTLITPCISGSFGIFKYVILKLQFYTRSYSSFYETTQGPIDRIRNSFFAAGIYMTLK